MVLKSRLSMVEKVGLDDYNSIMIVAPHPDDEIIGLGGYVIGQVRSGKRITIVYLTNGEKSLQDIDPEVVARERKSLTLTVLAKLGISTKNVVWLSLPDGGIPRYNSTGFNKSVMLLEKLVSKVSPDAVFVTHPLETWPYDHVAAFELAEAAIGKSSIHCDIFGYWVWLWYSMPLKHVALIDWNAVYRIPLHNIMQEKREMMNVYLKPLAPDGRPWSGILPRAMKKAFQYPYEVVARF